MNKKDVVEIMSKKTTKLAILSVVIVAMTAVLVPMLIEEAEARTDVTITSTAGPFFNADVHLVKGKFWAHPRFIPQEFPMVVKWTSWGGGIVGGGDEIGRFTGNVNLLGGEHPRVSLEYKNPTNVNERNECSIVVSPPLIGTCHIPPRGWSVSAVFNITFRDQNSDNNNCDLLTKFGGLDQLKIVREKLHC